VTRLARRIQSIFAVNSTAPSRSLSCRQRRSPTAEQLRRRRSDKGRRRHRRRSLKTGVTQGYLHDALIRAAITHASSRSRASSLWHLRSGATVSLAVM